MTLRQKRCLRIFEMNNYKQIVESFKSEDPNIDTIWRSIILFGKNTASYKFSLAKSLLELAEKDQTRFTFKDLAAVYAPHLISHIKEGMSQDTRSADSKLIKTYKQYLNQEIGFDQIVDFTAKYAFKDVIPRFHTVGAGLPFQFYEFEMEKKEINLSDNLYLLKSLDDGLLSAEVEARWRLVETAWNLGISVNHLETKVDSELNTLFLEGLGYRKSVTDVRDALSGYQKGLCFYSSVPIVKSTTDVDHFFPISKQNIHGLVNLNGVWNLVLADASANRSKSDKRADEIYLAKLYQRNEFYIASRHPLGETIAKQTGETPDKRKSFLRKQNELAKQYSAVSWII